MRKFSSILSAVLAVHLAAPLAPAQEVAVAHVPVPQAIPVSGTIVGAGGEVVRGTAAITFAVYADEDSVSPLWTETQVLQLDNRGRFSAWLGGTSGEGVPMALFVAGEARWLGIQAAGLPEQPRTRLLSVPYALKAADAETLGGLPVSAFVRVPATSSALPTTSAVREAGRRAEPAATASDTVPVAMEGLAQAATPFTTSLGSGALASNTASGTDNTAVGYRALFTNTTGTKNTAVGFQAMSQNSTGYTNTAVGWQALYGNTTGLRNTAIGAVALQSNTTGHDNHALGYGALLFNTTGYDNVGLGFYALGFNTTGWLNTAVGNGALRNNTTGYRNWAGGYEALYANTTGIDNAASGTNALHENTTGSYNSAFGRDALNASIDGFSNAAFGAGALAYNTSGSGNTAAGRNSLASNSTGGNNTALGFGALGSNFTGNGNIAIGTNAGAQTNGSNNIVIGHPGVVAESDAVYVGNSSHTKTVFGGGNVGIGTTAPSQKLHVAGEASTYAMIQSTQGNAGLALFTQYSSALLRTDAEDYGKLVIENPAGTPRLVVTEDGRLGVGTKNPGQAFELLGIPSQYVNLWSSAGNAGFVLTAGGAQGIVRENVADGSLAFENPNGTERMRIRSNGWVGIGTPMPNYPLEMGSGAHVTNGGVWTNASSRALKDHIVDLPAGDAVAALAGMRPVTFVYKTDPAEQQVGFIAEDVPDLVATNDRRSLSPMDIVAVAVRVIQTQQDTLQTQAANIDALRARVEELERLVAQLSAAKLR